MAITSDQAVAQYTAGSTGSGQSYPVPFYFLAAADIVVIRTTAGVDTNLALNTDYTVSGAGTNPSTATINGLTCTTGDVITIARNDDELQGTRYVSNGAFPASTTESAFDKLTMLVQKLAWKMGRSIRLPVSSPAVGELALSARKGMLLGFDGNGLPTLNAPLQVGIAVTAPTMVSSIAALRVLPISGLATGYQVPLSGYYNPGDGGAGVYVWNAVSTATDNGGTVIQPTGVPTGRWLLQFSGRINAKWFGVKGDGATDDTARIQTALAAIKALGGGELHFPQSSAAYVVTIPSGATAYSSQFVLASNMRVSFAPGATMTCSAVPGSNLFYNLFGIDQSALPVSNVGFFGLTVSQATPGGGQEQAQAIGLSTASNGAANQIQGVIIDGCTFTNFGSAVYILQRSTAGSTTRQVNGVKITSCRGTGNASFITANGQDILIQGCTAVGSVSAPGSFYDAVTILSGIGIRVIGNDFSYYGGQPINIRNSPENLCGTTDVLVQGNFIHECPGQNIQVAIASGESTYGTTNVVVSGNLITNSNASNGAVGIIVAPGGASAGTPFNSIVIADNVVRGLNGGIQVNSNTSFYLTACAITGNSVYISSSGTDYALRVQAMKYSTIANNSVQALGTGASYVPVSLTNLADSVTVSGNSFYTATTYTSGFTFDTWANVQMSGNVLNGKATFTNLGSTCVITGNRTPTACVVMGRPISNTYFEFADGVVRMVGGNAVPSSGTWALGDIQFKYPPTASDYIGFVCTTAGTPGTWKTFGAISA